VKPRKGPVLGILSSIESRTIDIYLGYISEIDRDLGLENRSTPEKGWTPCSNDWTYSCGYEHACLWLKGLDDEEQDVWVEVYRCAGWFGVNVMGQPTPRTRKSGTLRAKLWSNRMMKWGPAYADAYAISGFLREMASN
jgi:hypothetical protein